MSIKTVKYRSMKRGGEVLAAKFSQHFRSKGFFDIRLVVRWNEIVGDDIAARFSPKMIKKVKNKKTLFLESKSLEDLADILYYKSGIINRINHFLGSGSIEDIKPSMH